MNSDEPVCPSLFNDRRVITVAFVHGWIAILSGAWPLIAPASFQAVTGHKADFWLAQTVALQLLIVGAMLVLAARARRITREVALLGLCTATMFAAADLYAVTQPRTTRAYLLDAPLELAFALIWGVLLWRRRSRRAQ